MARTMTLNDGTRLEVCRCGADDGTLSAVVLGEHTMLELARTFSNPGATGHIEVAGVEMTDAFDGFTDLVLLNSVYWPGGIFIALQRGAT